MNIPFYYDPMIAKLICHAESREAAISKVIRAIDEYDITGVETTLGFCRFVMQHDAFRSGNFDTKFVETHFRPELLNATSGGEEEKIAAVLASLLVNGQSEATVPTPAGVTSNWKKNRT
jgi:propionyl-CoA carboxylase alpha chain